jgi:predicted dinucleotide-binding enzyme
MLSTGARAVIADDVVTDVEVLIVSVPLNRVPAIRPLIDKLPSEAIIIDTSNYYPMRDEHIPALDNGQVESLWIVEQLGRPAAKAWNAIVAGLSWWALFQLEGGRCSCETLLAPAAAGGC